MAADDEGERDGGVEVGAGDVASGGDEADEDEEADERDADGAERAVAYGVGEIAPQPAKTST